MLTAEPQSIFSWNFNVSEGSRVLATLRLGWMREAGNLRLGGESYRIGREGVMSGKFFLELDGRRIASADKPSPFTRLFQISVDSRKYTLRAESVFGRSFVLERGGRPVGSVRPMGLFTRRARIQFPEELPLPAQIFMTWLVIVLWRRAARNN